MLSNLFILILSLLVLIKGATLATKYAALLAQSYRLSKYIVGFIVVAVISILPETFIAINSALSNNSSFGLGVLFGSNIADLTLVFAIITFAAKRNLKVENKILNSHNIYPFILAVPILLGLNGQYSRLEGIILIICGTIFYYLALKNGASEPSFPVSAKLKYSIFLIFSMVALLGGAHFAVTSATTLAHQIGINPILIGMLIVGLGTTMPELFFALKSVRRKEDSLAVGDILGTVLADATIVVGILALIDPFAFPTRIIYIAGSFMVLASVVLFGLMRSGKNITRREASFLLFLWLCFVVVEFISNK